LGTVVLWAVTLQVTNLSADVASWSGLGAVVLWAVTLEVTGVAADVTSFVRRHVSD
jgi:hypothetical protein